MSKWKQSWGRLSSRMKGLIDGVHQYNSLCEPLKTGAPLVDNVLIPEAENILKEIQIFYQQFHAVLPDAANECLERFIEHTVLQQWRAKVTTYEVGLFKLHRFIIFTTLREELQYHLQDSETAHVKLVERSFAHLKYLLTIDEEVRTKWLRAFEERENYVEKLGAVHLLSHGIYSFKAKGIHAETDSIVQPIDLVREEPIDIAEVETVADVLILTEWKLVKEETEMKSKQKALEAKQEMKIYSSGVLGGIELTSRRYCVLVSKGRLPQQSDICDENNVYRVINIPIQPAYPSEDAKKLSNYR